MQRMQNMTINVQKTGKNMKTLEQKNQAKIELLQNAIINVENNISSIATKENYKKKVISDNSIFDNNSQSEIDEILKIMSVKDNEHSKGENGRYTTKQALENEVYYPIKTQIQGYNESTQEQDNEYNYYYEDDEIQDMIKNSSDNIYQADEILLQGESKARKQKRNQFNSSYLKLLDSNELASLNNNIYTPYVNRNNSSTLANSLQAEARITEDAVKRAELYTKAGLLYKKSIELKSKYKRFYGIEFCTDSRGNVKKSTNVTKRKPCKVIKLTRAKFVSRFKAKNKTMSKSKLDNALTIALKKAGYRKNK